MCPYALREVGPCAAPTGACIARASFRKNPSSAFFWYFGHNFLVLTPIRLPFKPKDSPFIPPQDCEIKLNLPLGFDGVWHVLW